MDTAVIFDMGGVLMDFDTHGLTAAVTAGGEDAALLHREMFEGPDWLTLDRGGTEERALDLMKRRLPQRLHPAADRAMARWDEFLTPIPEMNALAAELHGLDIPLYLLSNTSARFYSFREQVPAWPLLSGALLSFEEHLLKPDLDFYRRLFARFGLAPHDCFFIDDVNENIEAARWCGMWAFHYQRNVSKLRAALRQAGIPVCAEAERRDL